MCKITRLGYVTGPWVSLAQCSAPYFTPPQIYIHDTCHLEKKIKNDLVGVIAYTSCFLFFKIENSNNFLYKI